MPTWIRRSLWALLVLVLILAALATWLVLSFDPNRYKGVAIEWMRNEHQRTLTLDGPIELSVFPRLAVKLSKVAVSEPKRPDVFLSLDEAGLSVELWPLLRGNLVVGRVSARGVQVTYHRNAQGASNVDDFVQPGEGAKQQEAKRPVRFDVDGVELADVRARLRDEVAKVTGQVWLKSLSTGRLADQTSSPVKLAARFDFTQPAIQGELTGDTRLALDRAAGLISLRDMDLAFRGDVPGAKALNARAQGHVAWGGKQPGLDAEKLKLQVDAQTGGLALAGSQLAVERFRFEPDRKALTLRKLEARLKGTQAGQPLAVDLDWPELSVEADKLAGSPFSGRVSRGGAMPMEARFKSGAPSGSFDAVRLPSFEAQVTSQAAARKLEGQLHANLTLKPGAPSLAFDDLDVQARIDEPQLPTYAITLRGSALGSTKRSTWNVHGQLNQNAFASDGTATLGGAVPHVVAKAKFGALDLNRLMAPTAQTAPAGASPTKGTTEPAAAGHAADAPVDLSALRSVNGQFSLRAGRLAYQQYRLADAAIDATIDSGLLRVTQLQAHAWGGTLDATAIADARSQRVGVKGAASGVNVNALIKDVAAKDLIEGTGRVTIDVDTAGRTVQEMKSHLKGTAALNVRDGAIKGINLARTLRQAKALLNQDLAQRANQAEKTDFSELSASFQIADGVARSRDLDLKSPFLRLGGEGAIDLGRNRMDYVSRVTVTNTSKGQDGAELAALRGVTIPVRLAGPFDALDWRVEWSAVATAAVQRRVEDKLSEKLGEKLGLKPPAQAASDVSPKDALKNTLKGLFK
jgi:AsmA protein